MPGFVEMLVSMVALRGTGRGEVQGDLVGLTLAERDPFSSLFTSSSSVPVATELDQSFCCLNMPLLVTFSDYRPL